MIDSVILKESSDLDEQLKQLVEFSQKSLLEDIRELVEQDIRNLKAGINGENKLLFELKNSHIPMFVLRDLCIEDGDLSAQIDFFIITKKLFYVIECKNLYGNIEIDSNGNFIRTVHYGKRFQKTGIYSPITQNQRHLELLWKIRQKNMGFLTKTIFQNFSKNVFYRAIVVLANEQTVLNDKKAPKEIQEKVIRADKLIEYIKKEDAASKGFNSSEAEMWMFAKRFLDMHRKRNADYTQKYINKDIECKTKDPIANKSSAVENTAKPNPSLSEDKIICSKCGAPMVKRKVSSKGKDVGKEFWGCSKFPSCRNTVGLS